MWIISLEKGLVGNYFSKLVSSVKIMHEQKPEHAMKNHLYEFLYLPITQVVNKFTPGGKSLLLLLQGIVILCLIGFHVAMAQNLL